MTLRTDQLVRTRGDVEKQHLIRVDRGVIVYDAEARAWALPGQMHTTHRPAAERAAKLINLMMVGEIPGPRIVRGE